MAGNIDGFSGFAAFFPQTAWDRRLEQFKMVRKSGIVRNWLQSNAGNFFAGVWWVKVSKRMAEGK